MIFQTLYLSTNRLINKCLLSIFNLGLYLECCVYYNFNLSYTIAKRRNLLSICTIFYSESRIHCKSLSYRLDLTMQKSAEVILYSYLCKCM